MAKQEFPPLLPLGFHPMTIAEMRVALVDAFRGSKRRPLVMEGLEKILQKLSAENIQAEIWVDGSFLTKKIDPDDSDILVVIQGSFYDSATSPQKAVIDWLKTDLKADFNCHAFLHFIRPAGHADYDQFLWFNAYWLRQFGFNRKDEPKGIVTYNIP